jgi:hypothetical protein
MVDQILAVARPAELDHVRDVLMLIGYLRNSLHNNGIHRGGNLSVRFLDMEYDLTRDNAVACASWQHELAALFKTIGIIDEILAAPAIRNLQVPIPDAYALNPVT